MFRKEYENTSNASSTLNSSFFVSVQNMTKAYHSTLRHCYVCEKDIRSSQTLRPWLSIDGKYVYLCHLCNSIALGRRSNKGS